MYDVAKKQEAFKRLQDSIDKLVRTDSVESAFIVSKDKDGNFRYNYVGDTLPGYEWIGFFTKLANDAIYNLAEDEEEYD